MFNSPQELKNQLDLAIETAHQAGQLLMEGFDKEKIISSKSSDIDWVTEYDQASEKLIVEKLQAGTPDFGILGEEGSQINTENGFKWIIDPLDGTTNYTHGFPMFCVSIALYHHATPLVAVVYDPLRKETFHAVKGGGAFLTTPHGTQALHVSQEEDLKHSLLATGFPYDRHSSPHNNTTELAAFLKKTHGIRRAGSAALDLAYVAAGRLDGFWEFKLYPWDMGASRLLVEEAGGLVTQPDGQPVVMQQQLSLAVSNGRIHQQMLDVLKLAYEERKNNGAA